MKLKIEKDIPTPNVSTGRKKHKFPIPWSDMEDGDSVYVDTDNLKAAKSLCALASYYGHRYSCKYTIRSYYKYDGDGQKCLEGIRIWKVENGLF